MAPLALADTSAHDTHRNGPARAAGGGNPRSDPRAGVPGRRDSTRDRPCPGGGRPGQAHHRVELESAGIPGGGRRRPPRPADGSGHERRRRCPLGPSGDDPVRGCRQLALGQPGRDHGPGGADGSARSLRPEPRDPHGRSQGHRPRSPEHPALGRGDLHHRRGCGESSQVHGHRHHGTAGNATKSSSRPGTRAATR